MNIEQDQIDRFWSKVDKSPGQGPNGECWEWQAGQKNDEGYGGFYIRQINNTMNSHKVAFLIAHNFGLDDIPKDIVVRHRCNNPKCVRPEHLVMGTHKDNSQDMVRGGTSLAGTKNPRAKLDWDKVKTIREMWATGQYGTTQLAAQFGVTQAVIWHVVENRTWVVEDYQPIRVSKRDKFSNEVVEEIRRKRQEGVPLAALVQEYGISMSHIHNLVNHLQRKGGG